MVYWICSSILAIVTWIWVPYLMAEHRFSNCITLVLWSLAGILTGAFWFYLESIHAANQLVWAYFGGLIIQTAFFFITSRENPGQRLFLQLTFSTLFTLVTGILDIIYSKVFKTRNSFGYLLFNAALAVLVIWLFTRKLLPRAKKYGRYVENWLPFCLFSFLFFFLVVSMTIWPFPMGNPSWGRIFIHGILVLMTCFLLQMEFGSLKNMAEVSEAKKVELHRNLLLSQVETHQNLSEALQRSVHDMRHHSLVIAEYAKSGDYQGLLAYLGDQQTALNKINQPHYCSNEMLSLILTVYLNKARKEGIETEVSALAGKNLAVSSSDLVAIVANVLDNAINGCQKSHTPSPFIKIRVHEKADKFIIVCENSCKLTYFFDDKLPGNLRGTGISSIEDAASHYDGLCSFSAQKGVFFAEIVLNLPEGKVHS